MTTEHAPSRNCYLHGCRRPECELENYRYAKQLKLEHSRGEHRRQDATEVRAHIQQLLGNNWWLAEIARVSGVSGSTLKNLLTVSQTTHKDVARAVLSVPNVPILRTPLGKRVHALGSARRLQALAWLGHPSNDISKLTGITSDRLRFICCGNTDVIRPEEAQKIAAAYRVLSTKPGRMKQIATAARNKGWHGPLAWDQIDDPAAKPEGARKSRAKADSRRVVADVSRVASLTAAGHSAQQIADELGCHIRTVTRARRRAEMEVAA